MGSIAHHEQRDAHVILAIISRRLEHGHNSLGEEIQEIGTRDIEHRALGGRALASLAALREA